MSSDPPASGETATHCERCGVQIGAPHRWDDDDCVLDHAEHSERHVGLLCKRHYHWIDSTLSQILELFALTSPLPSLGWSNGDRTSSGEIDAAAPGRLDVLSLLDERSHRHRRDDDGIAIGPEYPNILLVVGGWVQAVVEEREPDLADTITLTGMIALLRKHRHWIAQQPWIDDYTIELNDIHHAMAHGARDTMWPAPIGKCPNCGVSLYNTIGVDEVTCRKCRSVWAGIHLARLRLVHEQEAYANGTRTG